MKKGYALKSSLLIATAIMFHVGLVIALVFMFVGGATDTSSVNVERYFTIISVLSLLTVILFVIGCCLYAVGKGQHPALGFLGLLNIFGLAILYFLEDKHSEKSSGVLRKILTLIGLCVLFFIGVILAAILIAKNPKLHNGLQSSLAKAYVVHSKVILSDEQKFQTKMQMTQLLKDAGETALPAITKTIEGLTAKGDEISSDDKIILDTLKSIKESIEQTPEAPRGSGVNTRSVLRNIAVTMEAYFIDNNTYTSCKNLECSQKLSKLQSIPDGVELIVKGDSRDFQAWVRDTGHPDFVYKWDSSQGGGVRSINSSEWPAN